MDKSLQLMNSPLRNISTVIRYSGFRLLSPETVDSHTMDMSVLALLILDDLPNHLDRKDLIYRIVIHDLEESCSCDVPRSLKYHSEEVRLAIDKATKELVSKHVSKLLLEDMDESKDLTVLEGRVVKFLDILQCCFILKREVIHQKNGPLRNVYEEACNFLEKAILKEDLFKNDDDEVRSYFRSIVSGFIDMKEV